MDSISTLSRIRREIITRYGSHTIKELHKKNSYIVFFSFIIILSSFLLFTWLLASLNFGIVWLLVFILQGFVLQSFGFFNHEVFVHKKINQPIIAYFGSLVCTLPITILPTIYKELHLRHHVFTNTEYDSEEYKKDLDTRWKRLLFLTFIGHKLAINRKLASKKNKNINKNLISYVEIEDIDNNKKKNLKTEKKIYYLFILTIIILAFFYTKVIIYGYILPLLIAFPIASAMRMIIEHTEVDLEREIQITTFYKTNILTRLLFLYDSGDCHLVHHIFPGIPFYRIGKALKILQPYFIEKGIVERKSFLGIIYGYFIKNYTYGKPWPIQ